MPIDLVSINARDDHHKVISLMAIVIRMTDPAPGPARRPASPAEIAGIVFARLRRGVKLPGGRVVGETDREVHLISVPAGADRPAVLVAYCGLVIRPGQADLVDTLSGMPCPLCMVRSPDPTTR